MPASTLPDLDLTTYAHGDAAARAAFGRALFEGLRDHGFVALRGHGVSPQLVAAAHLAAERVFAASEADKARCAGRLLGYTPFGVERAPLGRDADPKELWQIGQGGPYDRRNVWPACVPEARVVWTELYDALLGTGLLLLDALAPSLGVPPEFFGERILGGASMLRVVHYPPADPGASAGSVRAAPREDMALMTLMPAARGPGLQIRMPDGSWVPVQADRDALIVHAGDLMDHWTGGVLPATTHRVVHARASAAHSRYALPFLLQPRADVVLEELPSCRTARPARPVTAGELLEQRLAEIGLPTAMPSLPPPDPPQPMQRVANG